MGGKIIISFCSGPPSVNSALVNYQGSHIAYLHSFELEISALFFSDTFFQSTFVLEPLV